MNYKLFTFSELSEESQEILIAQLSEVGFEGFEQEETILKAFIPDNLYETQIDFLKEELSNFKFEICEIQNQNWNALWESNFEPILVEDKVHIRADFHPERKDVDFDLLIHPRMSFGTGHHATTHLMITQMLKIEFKDKNVLDFGCGTGILGILASKLNAKSIIGIDNEENAVANSIENAEKNECTNCSFFLNDKVDFNDQKDIVLANITKNVIAEHHNKLAEIVVDNGYIFTSGYYDFDAEVVSKMFTNIGFEKLFENERNQWICQVFKKIK